MNGSPSDSLNRDDRSVTRVTLDRGQRQRAIRLEEAVSNDPLEAAYELVHLRDELARLNGSIAVRDVVLERVRQVELEGWTAEHDDQHTGGQLAKAASCYALCAGVGIATAAGLERHYEFVAEYSRAGCPNQKLWPWEARWWKPKTPRRDLVRAAALIIAEIERIDRETNRG